jgi:hypothetical protein
MPFNSSIVIRLAAFIVLLCSALSPAHAQQGRVACTALLDVHERLASIYGKWDVPFASAELAEGQQTGGTAPAQRLDRQLLQNALASYRANHCRGDYGSGPVHMVVIDFAKPSAEPRLYAVNLLSGFGIDMPIAVAHGIGSDPDDNGIADQFSNRPESLMSSLGAARGAELYSGANGLSLRLDGLEPSNSLMRARDIVVHSYQPARRRYFNASLVGERNGKPGTSEGCIVVAPHYRDWLFAILGNGGFLYAGLGGERYREMEAIMPPAPSWRSDGSVVYILTTGG